MKNELEENVLNFIKRCGDKIAKFERYHFEGDIYFDCLCKTKSPIERILYCALETIIRLNFMEQSEPEYIDGEFYAKGVTVIPQRKIGNYRVDFLVVHRGTYIDRTKQKIEKIIVECDSQEFHERTEPERRHEKTRDRFLVSKGYKIFHFTGSEIFEDAFSVAAEILSYITNTKLEDIMLESESS